jgi:outer membrane protein assembly factor BamB
MRWGLAAALALMLAGCDWSAYLSGPTHSSYSLADKITPANAGALVKAWSWTPDAGTMPGQPAGGVYAAPTVVNHVIYVGANTGVFYALDETSGRVLWKRLLGFQPTLTCPATGIISTATVVSQPDGAGVPCRSSTWLRPTATSLDGRNGSTVASVVRRFDHGQRRVQLVLAHGRRRSDHLRRTAMCRHPRRRDALQPTNGQTRHPVRGACRPEGRRRLDVVVSNGFAYAATGSGDPGVTANTNSLVKLDGNSLQELGSFHLPPADTTAEDPDFGSSPLVFAASLGGRTTELVGACNKNGYWYTLRTSDMSLLWKLKVGTATDGAMRARGGIFDGPRLFVSGNDDDQRDGLPGFDQQSIPRRAVVWARGLSANVPGPPALNRGGVLVEATHDYIPSGLPQHAYLINAATGSVITTLDNGNAKEFSQPVFADQYLLLTTLNRMYAYRP